MSGRILILGLGNDIIGDDAIGVLAARELAKVLTDSDVEVVESSMSGLALLDYFLGFEKAIIIDAIKSSAGVPGTIRELTSDDLDPVIAPSPHYAGLPEMLAIANQLDLEFPEEIMIYAVEVNDPMTIGDRISTPVSAALPGLVEKVKAKLAEWKRS